MEHIRNFLTVKKVNFIKEKSFSLCRFQGSRTPEGIMEMVWPLDKKANRRRSE